MSKSETQAIDSLTLKRQVTVKAVVTEQFKKFLVLELNQAIQGAKNRLSEVDALKQTYSGDDLTQLESEKQKLIYTIQDLDKRIHQAKALKLNSLFLQGVIDGLAVIKKGDNLYQKLGSVEILLKDGIVQDISLLDHFVPNSEMLAKKEPVRS